jgi:hypothetical protein
VFGRQRRVQIVLLKLIIEIRNGVIWPTVRSDGYIFVIKNRDRNGR